MLNYIFLEISLLWTTKTIGEQPDAVKRWLLDNLDHFLIRIPVADLRSRNKQPNPVGRDTSRFMDENSTDNLLLAGVSKKCQWHKNTCIAKIRLFSER